MAFRPGIMAIALLACALGASAANAADISRLSDGMRAAMTGKSWKPGCPVPLDDLVAVQVRYLGFDGLSHTGTVIVHKLLGTDVAAIFEELYAAKFPINKIAPWENYGPDVYAEQNITVGFYCEKADDAPNEWSSHAYGFAIDINPLYNPFLDLQHHWWPKVAATYVTRDDAPGKISPNTEAFKIFSRHGWAWGGFDAGVPDYMHFNKLSAGDGSDRLKKPYLVTGLQYMPDATQTPSPAK